jgi:hypothetical protein
VSRVRVEFPINAADADHTVVNVVWAGFRKLDNFAVQFAETILPLAEKHPELRASLLYCASRHRDALTGVRDDHFNRQMLLKSWALREVRQALFSLHGAEYGDALVHSILCLAVNDNTACMPVQEPDPSPFMPPMRSRHWLQHYGTMQFDSNHWDACKQVIRVRGGIHKLEAYGTAWLVS